MNTSILIDFLKQTMMKMSENKEYLIEIDGIVGDGDLGLTMSDGFLAAYNAVADGTITDAGMILYMAGKSMSVAVPSTMGTLMASGLMQAGKELKGKVELNDQDFVSLFQAYFDGVANRGKAKIGEKTFLDGLAPAIEALRIALDSGQSIEHSAELAWEGAKKGFADTTTMLACHGRAATRGEDSRKLLDAGAAVAVLMMEAFKDTFNN